MKRPWTVDMDNLLSLPLARLHQRRTYARPSYLLLTLLLAFSAPSWSQEPTPSKAAAIDDLIQLTNAAAISQQYAEFVSQQYIQLIRQYKPQTPAYIETLIIETVNRILTTPDNSANLLARLRPIYDRNFSHQELLDLLAFYQTPLGTKLRNVTPIISNESTFAGEEWVRELAPHIREKILEQLSLQGIEID